MPSKQDEMKDVKWHAIKQIEYLKCQAEVILCKSAKKHHRFTNFLTFHIVSYRVFSRPRCRCLWHLIRWASRRERLSRSKWTKSVLLDVKSKLKNTFSDVFSLAWHPFSWQFWTSIWRANKDVGSVFSSHRQFWTQHNSAWMEFYKMLRNLSFSIFAWSTSFQRITFSDLFYFSWFPVPGEQHLHEWLPIFKDLPYTEIHAKFQNWQLEHRIHTVVTVVCWNFVKYTCHLWEIWDIKREWGPSWAAATSAICFGLAHHFQSKSQQMFHHQVWPCISSSVWQVRTLSMWWSAIVLLSDI